MYSYETGEGHAQYPGHNTQVHGILLIFVNNIETHNPEWAHPQKSKSPSRSRRTRNMELFSYH